MTTLNRPNIVFFLTDDQTFDSLQHMPVLNSMSWINFTNAWVENALCCPSRATILQGRYDTRTGVGNNVQGWRFNPTETIAVWLQRRGYTTALIGKYLNGVSLSKRTPPGWNDWEAVLPNPYMYQQYNYTKNDNGVPRSYGSDPGSYETNVFATRAENYIAAHATTGQPFFLYFAPTATHDPWVASPSRTGMFGSAPVTLPPAYNEADVSDKPAWVRVLPLQDRAVTIDEIRRSWAAGVSVDDALSGILAQLSASGILGNTVFFFMTDNGWSNGNQRYRARCANMPTAARCRSACSIRGWPRTTCRPGCPMSTSPPRSRTSPVRRWG